MKNNNLNYKPFKGAFFGLVLSVLIVVALFYVAPLFIDLCAYLISVLSLANFVFLCIAFVSGFITYLLLK